MRLISLYSAFYAGNCKHDTTRPCFCSAFAAGHWPYSNLPISLLPIGPTRTNPLHATAVVNSMGQTDLYPAAYYVSIVNKEAVLCWLLHAFVAQMSGAGGFASQQWLASWKSVKQCLKTRSRTACVQSRGTLSEEQVQSRKTSVF